MGTSKQQRRADKKRRAAQARQAAAQQAAAAVAGVVGGRAGTSPCRGEPSHRGASQTHAHRGASRGPEPDPSELITMAASLAWRPESEVLRDRIVEALVDADGRADELRSTAARPESLVGDRLVESIAASWERGWQPADLVHVVRREVSPRAGRVVIAMIQAEDHNARRHDRMPEAWSDQLVALGVALPSSSAGSSAGSSAASSNGSPPQPTLFADEPEPVESRPTSAPTPPPTPPPASPLGAWRVAERVGLAEALDDGLRVLGYLRVLPAIAMIGPPPSRWSVSTTGRPLGDLADSTRSAEAAPAASVKTLATIRALLAKAESSTFASEAEAFAAKAQELMTRYSIDAAVFDSGSDHDVAAGVRSRRFHLDNPYAKEKVELLSTVGSLNRVKIVFHTSFGMATAVGFPQDLELTDLLFTSLLVQASRALHEASSAARRTSSPAFKRGFWVAYAQRIGERLAEAQTQASSEAEAAYGSALVPVLQARSDAVDQVVDSLFSNLQPMKSRSVDAHGWHAGRAAADKASLGHHHGALRPAR